MTTTFTLTEKETKLAQAGNINWDYFCDPEMGYDNVDGDPDALLFTLRDGKEAGFSKHEQAGLIGSLEKKNVIFIEHRDPIYEGPDLFWLTEDFVNFIAAKNKAEGKTFENVGSFYN